ncbi:M14 family metallopeptidase [Azohydromonas lata]|uniref:M14 family metallopeptidase n=1 Tax=Azohydromonas lata TaxID=45677 RepID=A0ABU5I8L8_9BURK|nr:M14 family metallopeptidase [Azohydromonas lata]MDZ5455441.1 M14 family metallopeptidase [Azohydromonas lata]
MDADALNTCFSHKYSEAREKFLAAADAAGLDAHAEIHPLLGQDGETLALDVARCGPISADKLLLVSSGCHGVEGYAGSAVQISLLRDANFLEQAQQAGVAVLFLHALNPWGMSWMRRTTQENVDLNRNFQDFNHPLPANPGYDELHPLLVPSTWPPSPENEQKLQAVLAQRGMAVLQQIVSSGQYSEPEGLFYGGHAPTWSQQALRHVLRDHARRCSKLGWVDLHSGLGATGQAEIIFSGDGSDPAQVERARAWWPTLKTMHEHTSSSAVISGAMWSVIGQECPQAEFTGMGFEFGTVPPLHILQAMRADQWLENHPEKPLRTPLAQGIRKALFGVFFVDTMEWKKGLIEQGLATTQAGLRGLIAG